MAEAAASPLDLLAAAIAGQRLPPVETWHPAHCGTSDMRIARDGSWTYRDSPIDRPEMVRLFSSILRREADGRFVLVTPAEKLDIMVEDAPFVATGLLAEGAGRDRRLAFALNTGDAVMAGADHLVRVAGGPGGPRPYLHVRGGLEALVARSVYYELVDLALADGNVPPGLWSHGAFFTLEPA